MQLSEAIRARRSIRKYKTGIVVPRADLEKILEAAMICLLYTSGKRAQPDLCHAGD